MVVHFVETNFALSFSYNLQQQRKQIEFKWFFLNVKICCRFWTRRYIFVVLHKNNLEKGEFRKK